MVKDSGARSHFATGAVRDIREGKGRVDLIPNEFMAYVLDNGLFTNLEYFKETGDIQALYEIILEWSDEVYDSLPDMLLNLAIHFEEGAAKYGDSNWQKGIPLHCYIDSALRHHLKYLRGDTDENHERARIWNLVCAIWTYQHLPEMDDYTDKGVKDNDQRAD